jgi:hypothetical protein
MKEDASTLGNSTSPILSALQEQTQTIIKTGLPSMSTHFTYDRTGSWIKFCVKKHRGETGLVHAYARMTPLDDLYFGWPSHLCQLRQRLSIHDGKYLSARDLAVLHWFVLGTPRKEIAAKTFVTVKAIEKRLTKLKEMLAPSGYPDASLHTSLYSLKLYEFLIAQNNWFDIRSNLIIHR